MPLEDIYEASHTSGTEQPQLPQQPHRIVARRCMRAPPDTRSRVLSLYRRILRTSRTWQGGKEEREYIEREARSQFRRNAAAHDPADVDAMVQEAEQRLEYGLHYGIPYPRLHHASQFPRRYTLTAPQMEPSALPQSKDADVAAKLAAAAERRRAKLERAKRKAEEGNAS
ncbi:g8505 [Coccomyxa elongata]